LDWHWELPFCFTPQKGKQGCPPKDKHLWEHQCYKSGEFLWRNDDVKGKGQNYICCKTFSLKYNNETI
jgi:hypothetical protein